GRSAGDEHRAHQDSGAGESGSLRPGLDAGRQGLERGRLGSAPHRAAVRAVRGRRRPLMRFLPATSQDQRAMLETIGARGIEDVLVKIPAKSRLDRPLALPPALAGRPEVVLAGGVHPLYRRVVATYCDGPGVKLRDVAAPAGVLDAAAVTKAVGAKTAALVVQSPNFYGCLENVAAAAEIAHAAGALLVVVADPVNLGVLEAPGRLGADIVVGDGQGLGVPLSYGGPYLGVFAAKNEL